MIELNPDVDGCRSDINEIDMNFDVGYGISIWDTVYRYDYLPCRFGHPGYRYGIWANDMGDDSIDMVISHINMGYLVTLCKPLASGAAHGVQRVHGRGLHSSTFQLNLSRFRHNIPPTLRLFPPDTSYTLTKQPLNTPPIPQKVLTLSQKVDECKPLVHGRRRRRHHGVEAVGSHQGAIHAQPAGAPTPPLSRLTFMHF